VLTEQVEVLESRCKKLAKAARSAEAKAEAAGAAQAEAAAAVSEAGTGSRLPQLVDQMLRSPMDEAIQLQGIECLFSQFLQVDGADTLVSAPARHGSLEAAVGIFVNHPNNHTLLLKAAQFLSLLLSEQSVQQQFPFALLLQAAQSVVTASVQLLEDPAAAAVGSSLDGKAGSPGAKALKWILSLLELLVPCVGPQLKEQHEQSETLVEDLLKNLASRLLSSADVPQEVLMLKCAQLIPMLPMAPWIQKACLDTETVHSLALAYHRCASGSARTDAQLPKAIQMAVRGIFADNLEICVKALDDTFVSDEFVCLEVLDELRSMEKKQRGTFRVLDSDWGITSKALRLWDFHQRKALEDPDPMKSSSRDVLQRVSDLLSGVLVKLSPQVLLQRMQEFQDWEVLQRLALAAIHSSAQLRLQLAVNYVENGIIPIAIGCMQTFLRHFECSEAGVNPPASEVEAAFKLLSNKDGVLPPDVWKYVLYALEVCLHVLSHWSATKLSLKQKAEVIDERAAPLLLAKAGLVDVLVEIMDPRSAGLEMSAKAPDLVQKKATETLQALFEQNGHICLFCMQHYSEVRQMVAMGCDSIALDPLAQFPQLQQQAVEQLMASFEKFSVDDERTAKKILKALTVLFESSYQLVAWFLQQHPLSTVGEYQPLDVHVQAVRAVARAPYWSAEDAPLLPEFVGLLADLLLDCVEGHGEEPGAPPRKPSGRVVDLTEAEEVVSACMSSVLHLLLIDPSPPTVLLCLAQGLGRNSKVEGEATDGHERAVNAVMKVMQVFPSSDRVQLNCQHLLTSLLRE